MAYLRKYVGSKYWYAGFNLPNGDRVQRSTKQTDRAKAMKLALQFEEAARNRATEAQVVRILGEIVEQTSGTRLSQVSVKEYATTWLARKVGETGPATLLAYRSAVENLLKHLGSKASTPLSHLSTAMIAEWRDKSAKKASPRTANNKAKIVRIMLQSAWRDGLLTDNPAAKLQSLKTGESTRRPFTIPEIQAVLDVADHEWRGMILAGFYTGQRLRDIAELQWTNVDLVKNEIRLQTNKTARRQFIPIAVPLRAYLEALPTSDNPKAYIFPTLHSKRSAQLSALFHKILEDAGLAKVRTSKEQAEGKGIGRDGPRERNEISFHCLRHTATSLLKEYGVPESVARDIIGHDSAQISQHYTHTSDDSRKAAINKLPDVTARK